VAALFAELAEKSRCKGIDGWFFAASSCSSWQVPPRSLPSELWRYSASFCTNRPTINFNQIIVSLRRYLIACVRCLITTERQKTITLTELNSGEWKTACLFGGYTDPLEAMRVHGANIDEKDRVRFTEAGSRGFRLGQVEEHEMAIAFVDLGNNARFIHFRTGIGPGGQHLRRCISKPQTRLYLAQP
jgi:hypothetical protein